MPQWFIFLPMARAQLRGIDQISAQRILIAINQLRFGRGNIKPMEGSRPPAKRLKIGKYRVIYRELPGNRFEIQRVGARGGVYNH